MPRKPSNFVPEKGGNGSCKKGGDRGDWVMTSRVLLYATMSWPSAARYAGGFAAAGCEVHAACPDGALVALSRYVARTHGYQPIAPLASLKRAITESMPDLIVACDDRAVAQLVRLHAAETKKSGVPSSIARIIARSL